MFEFGDAQSTASYQYVLLGTSGKIYQFASDTPVPGYNTCEPGLVSTVLNTPYADGVLHGIVNSPNGRGASPACLTPQQAASAVAQGPSSFFPVNESDIPVSVQTHAQDNGNSWVSAIGGINWPVAIGMIAVVVGIPAFLIVSHNCRKRKAHV